MYHDIEHNLALMEKLGIEKRLDICKEIETTIIEDELRIKYGKSSGCGF